MAKPEILSQTPVNVAELKEKLKMVSERDSELNFRANKTEEYLNQITTLDPKKAAELKEKLEKLNISRLKEEHIIKIIDLLPMSVEELKVILQAYTITITKEHLKKIADVVKEYVTEGK